MNRTERLEKLHQLGVSLWLDSLSREMLNSGELERRIKEDALRGQTSNPSIFESAVSKGNSYDESVLQMARAGKGHQEICWKLMVDDVQRACDMFKALYAESKGGDGYVSLELDPTKAHDTDFSIKQGKELWAAVDRPNLMLKVPATPEGLPVIEELISLGYNVNVTLLFSVDRYRQVMESFMKGLERRQKAGQSLEGIASVASFFISRVDSEVDKRFNSLDQDTSHLRGKVAVANARAAYSAFLEVFASPRWKTLEAAGAKLQRPLWASTSTKNDDYPDTLYVDDLIGEHCVNTVPESTLDAFADHGTLKKTLTPENLAHAAEILKQVAQVGVDMADVTDNTLMSEGVAKFAKSFNSLLGTIESSMRELQAT